MGGPRFKTGLQVLFKERKKIASEYKEPSVALLISIALLEQSTFAHKLEAPCFLFSPT